MVKSKQPVFKWESERRLRKMYLYPDGCVLLDRTSLSVDVGRTGKQKIYFMDERKLMYTSTITAPLFGGKLPMSLYCGFKYVDEIMFTCVCIAKDAPPPSDNTISASVNRQMVGLKSFQVHLLRAEELPPVEWAYHKVKYL